MRQGRGCGLERRASLLATLGALAECYGPREFASWRNVEAEAVCNRWQAGMLAAPVAAAVNVTVARLVTSLRNRMNFRANGISNGFGCRSIQTSATSRGSNASSVSAWPLRKRLSTSSPRTRSMNGSFSSRSRSLRRNESFCERQGVAQDCIGETIHENDRKWKAILRRNTHYAYFAKNA